MSSFRSFPIRFAALFIAGVTIVSCGSDAGSAPAATEAPSSVETTAAPDSTVPATDAPTTAAPTTVVAQPSSMRGKRYCEVLLVTPKDAGFTARVFSTYTLNECAPDTWAALDPTAIAAENGVPVALLNGPRYWLLDSVTKNREGALNVVNFGGLDMNELAVVTVTQRLDGLKPYVPSSVERKTVFTFAAGSTVYELTDPNGATYVMQSWSQQVEPTLEEADLAGLGSRLTLPTGWTYSSRVLSETLEVVTVDVPAQVLQDDLRNSYSLETDG